MKNLINVFSLLLIQVALFAQKPLVNITPFGEDVNKTPLSISGALYDEANKEPVIFANVAIYNSDSKLVTGVETNLKGEYSIKNIKPGYYFMEASFIGYKTIRTGHILLFDTDISGHYL